MSNIDAELDGLLGESSEPTSAPVVRPEAFNRAPHPQWERCRGWLVIEGDPVRIQDIEAQIARGDAFLWPGEKSAIVMEIVAYPSGLKVYQTVAAGGDLAEIEAMIPGVEAFGRNQGCTLVRVEGRRGWERRMKAFGYKFHSAILTKEL